MKFDKLRKILGEHELWLTGKGGKHADLSFADLRHADLSFADLHSADLNHANFNHATLNYATLSHATFNHATLNYATLSYADLSFANLYSANLHSADLHSADLSSANLRSADLNHANLSYACYSVMNILQADWGQLSDKLTLELMRHDALSCGTAAMTAWAKDNGSCPFDTMERDFLFEDKKELWKPGKPKLFGRALLEALAEEKKIKL